MSDITPEQLAAIEAWLCRDPGATTPRSGLRALHTAYTAARAECALLQTALATAEGARDAARAERRGAVADGQNRAIKWGQQLGIMQRQRDEANGRAEAAEHRAQSAEAAVESLTYLLEKQREKTQGACKDLTATEQQAATLRDRVGDYLSALDTAGSASMRTDDDFAAYDAIDARLTQAEEAMRQAALAWTAPCEECHGTGIWGERPEDGAPLVCTACAPETRR